MTNTIKPMLGRENLYIGPAGWSYPDWRGIFYPGKAPRNFDELAYIAQYFDLVEINSSYYHPQSPEASKNWITRVQANPRFRFTAKLWQKFVLERSSYTSEDVKMVKRGLDVLMEHDRFGALLLQFPQSFHNTLDNRSWLFRIINEFRMYPLVVELRHQSWNFKETLNFLKDYQVGFANIDQPVIGKGLGFTTHITSSIAYFRFHGRNKQMWFNENASRDQRYDYTYSQQELREFLQPVQLALKQTTAVYVVFNNHFRGQAPKNALEFAYLLTAVKPAIPDPLVNAFPELVQIRRPENPQQLELF
ncbi:MAG: DUF72 domain-containing protein [Calditrichaeota bacterium]|nr:MAG: DUF72 domain-containing protein [Calditrichota bacterium]